MASHKVSTIKRRKCDGKRRFRDEQEAKAALQVITSRSDKEKLPVRWYFHDPDEGGCNGYHLTSQER